MLFGSLLAAAVLSGTAAELRVSPDGELRSLDAALARIRFVAERPGTAVFDGGVELPPFRRGAKGRWETTVPEGVLSEQLYVNGSWAVRARSPNRFWFHAADSIPEGDDLVTGKAVELGKRAFYAHLGDVRPLLGKSAEELREVVICHYHSWECSQARVESVDPQTGFLVETPSCHWSIYEWRHQAAPRYVLENFPEALDAPGEWYFDRTTRVLRYLPRTGEKLATARAVVPVAEQLVVVKGDRVGGSPVEDVTFEGIFFVNSAYRLPPDGQASRQASDGIDEAWMKANLPADEPRRGDRVEMGDMNTTLIKTRLGRSIMVQHDVSSPRPYSRIQLLTGTRGAICDYPFRVVLEDRPGSGAHEWFGEAKANEIREKHRHPLWKKVGKIAEKVGGHGGMDFIMDLRWAYCLQNGLPLDQDVYDLAASCCLCELTEKSVRNESASIRLPDFTCGNWRNVPPLGVLDIDLSKLDFGDRIQKDPAALNV